MAWTLRLYRGITPNEGRNTHYLFSSALDYINELESARIGDILLDNFRINANRAEINATPTLEETFNEITYAIVYDADTRYFRAYWVTSSVNESGMIKLTLNVDLWASSIMGARFGDMHVTRCNREIDEGGYFDDIKQCRAIINGEGDISLDANNLTLPLSQLAVVFKLQFVTSQHLFGTQTISETKLFYFTAQQLYDAMRGAIVDKDGHPTGKYDSINIIEKISNWLGGVYGTEAQVSTLPAQVVRAWLVPLTIVESEPSYVSYRMDGIVSKCSLTAYEECYMDARPVCPLRFVKKFELLNVLSRGLSDPWTARDGVARFNWTAGTPFNGLNLSRRVHGELSFIFSFETDALKVLVDEGGRQADVSNAFELSVTGNNNTESTLIRILNAIGYGLNVATGVFKSGASGASGGTAGVVAGLITGVADTAGSLLSSATYGRPLSQVSTGDGAGTYAVYEASGNIKVASPYRLTRYESVQDEIENANENGVNYDTFISSLDEATEKRLVCSSTWLFGNVVKTFSRTDETYIAINDMKLDGVQENAKDYIKNEFRRGIFYKSI